MTEHADKYIAAFGLQVTDWHFDYCRQLNCKCIELEHIRFAPILTEQRQGYRAKHVKIVVLWCMFFDYLLQCMFLFVWKGLEMSGRIKSDLILKKELYVAAFVLNVE